MIHAHERRGIPLVDVYLSGTGGPQGTAEGMWMWQGGISIPFAETIAAWFESVGVKVERDAAINGPLFEGVKNA